MTYPTYDPGSRQPPRPPYQNFYDPGAGQQPYRPAPFVPRQPGPRYAPQTAAQRFGFEPVPSWAPPPPPKRAGARPWLIAGLFTLLVSGGIGLAFFLHSNPAAVETDPPPQSAPGNGQSEPTENRQVPSPPTDCLVECSQAPAPPAGSGSGAHYSGSVDAAAAFVQDIANGNVDSAHDALCGAGKSQFPTPDELLEDFYATLGISQITSAEITDVGAADDVADAVVFDLETDVGTITADVFIVEEASALTVCGYDIAP